MRIPARTARWLAVTLVIGMAACAQRERAAGGEDATVKVEVERRLAADPDLAPAASSIVVAADDGTVVLTGNVPSEALKREAGSVADDVDGVERVQNQLVVARADTGAPAGQIR